MARIFSSQAARSIFLLSTGVHMQTSMTRCWTNAFIVPTSNPYSHHDYHRHYPKVLFSTSKNMNSSSDKKKVKYNKKKRQDLFRADRVLSNRGMGTRKECFALLKARRIMMIVNDNDDDDDKRVPLKGPSDKIPMDAKLILDGTHEVPAPPPLLYIYHKPKNMLSAMKEDATDKAHLGQVLAPHLIKGGMHPVGRLDYDTSGLLLFSSDGDLTQRLLHPRHAVEKEYVATVENDVDVERLSQKLESGVETSEGIHTAKLLGLEGTNNVRLVVQEGKYRMVRRMLANCGHPVLELRRERHGQVCLNDLNVGEFRDATDEELQWAESLLSPPSKKKK